MHPKVTVVILNYNGKHFLEKFLPGVIKYSSPYDVVIADNASTDDSLSFLQHHFSSIQVIKNSNNFGYAKGYNEALKQIESDYYVLLNNDVEVTENWLQPMVDLLILNRNIAVCQPKLIDFNSRNLFEYAGASGGFIDEFGYPFCRGRIFNSVEEDKNQYQLPTPIFWASGACLMVDANVYWKVGGLDDDYFAHMEEIDLCWRIKNLGYQVYVNPASTVYHIGGGTLNKMSTQKTFLNFRNSLITLTKDHPSNGLFFKIMSRLILDGVAGFKFLVSLQGAHCWAILRAHISYYSILPQTLEKRKALMAMKGYKPSLALAYKGSIVYAHFIKGITKFTDLKNGFFTS